MLSVLTVVSNHSFFDRNHLVNIYKEEVGWEVARTPEGSAEGAV